MKRDYVDDLFSKYIRRRGGYCCQRCGKQYPEKSRGLHCAHIITRGKISMRWDPTNAIALCYGCHRYCDQNKKSVLYPLYISLFGQERFDILQFRSKQPGEPDRAAAALWLRAELKGTR